MKPIHRNAFPAYVASKGFSGTIVEVGVAEGKYAEQLLAVWPFKYIGVDRWCHIDGYVDVMNGPDAEHEQRYQEALAIIAAAGPRATLLRMDSLAAAATFADQSLDMVYIDADHSLEGCCADIHAWYPKVKKGGGIIAGHDYYDKFDAASGANFQCRSAVSRMFNGPCGVTHEPCPSWWCEIG